MLRQLICTLSAGRPQRALGLAWNDAPEWFTAMDRNPDGDISRREYLGSPEQFTASDRDADGLLSPQEVAAGLTSPPAAQE